MLHVGTNEKKNGTSQAHGGRAQAIKRGHEGDREGMKDENWLHRACALQTGRRWHKPRAPAADVRGLESSSQAVAGACETLGCTWRRSAPNAQAHAKPAETATLSLSEERLAAGEHGSESSLELASSASSSSSSSLSSGLSSAARQAAASSSRAFARAELRGSGRLGAGESDASGGMASSRSLGTRAGEAVMCAAATGRVGSRSARLSTGEAAPRRALRCAVENALGASGAEEASSSDAGATSRSALNGAEDAAGKGAPE